MIVSRLIEILQEHDPNAKVIGASDEEGNSFSSTVAVGTGFIPKNEGYIEFMYSDLEELRGEAESYDEQFDPNNYESVVCIWP